MSRVIKYCDTIIECLNEIKSLQMKDEYTYSMDKNELMNKLRTQPIEENQHLIQSMLNEMAHNGSIYQQKLRQASLIITEMIKIDKNSVHNFEVLKELQRYYRYQPSKSKWEITVEVMMIIGKYFQSNNDFINIMKVSKKYRDLSQKYHYNPIGDPSLFNKIKIQHFYKGEDIPYKIKTLRKYKYWFPISTTDDLYEKYITNNINKLEEWSGKKYSKVIYDTDINEKDNDTFIHCIENHKQLYFIVIDDKNNVFGHYHPKNVNTEDNPCDDIFVFTLFSNGRTGIKKYNVTYREDDSIREERKRRREQMFDLMFFGGGSGMIPDSNNVGTFINPDDGHYYSLMYEYDPDYTDYPDIFWCIDINEVGYRSSSIDKHIETLCNGIDKKVLTGSYKPNYFTTKRLIVIEMN